MTSEICVDQDRFITKYVKNSVDPDELASSEASFKPIWVCTVFKIWYSISEKLAEKCEYDMDS